MVAMGNLNSVTSTRRVTLDPIAAGTAREEELHFVKGLDACDMKPQSDTV